MNDLPALAKLIRYYILLMTTQAGSGHVTSSLSAVELMTTLFFGGFFKADLENTAYTNNDRLIFSKGHASPLLYGLYAAAEQVGVEELKTFRQVTSKLEGHPTPRFSHTEVATGSLGQGLSVGLGLALNAKYLDKLSYKTYVLLGDSELAEGQNWEAMQLAAHYKLNNLIGIVDVNRLGQRGPTMAGYQLDFYVKKAEAFGWQAVTVEDGHDLKQIKDAYQQALASKNQPTLIIAKTVKGQDISFLENKEGWHGKVLNNDQFQAALAELRPLDKKVRGSVSAPPTQNPATIKVKQTKAAAKIEKHSIKPQQGKLATRHAYGNALAKLGASNEKVVALDAEVSNSTYSQIFKQVFPDRFFEMFIAEQNMVSAGVGLAAAGKIPYLSSFAAFLSRAYDQIRMAQYSQANLKLVGSHAGVSIGYDGPSQMGLEDLAFFRTLRDAVILYPSDAVSTEKLVMVLAEYSGLAYLRTTRMRTPILYDEAEEFAIGGSKTLCASAYDLATIVAAGVTVHEALKAQQFLEKQGIKVRVIDLYSIKPLDEETLKKAAQETQAIITVEDHYPEGGLGEAVKSVLVNQPTPIHSLAVKEMPRSGSPEDLLRLMEIDAKAIVEKVKAIL